jgi:hypothetical protein
MRTRLKTRAKETCSNSPAGSLTAELFRIQKWSAGTDRWASVKRSKAYIADKFFPPFNLKEGTLLSLFAQKDVIAHPESAEY